MKKNVGIIIGIVVVVIALILAFKPASMEQKLNGVYKDIQHYEIEGQMELTSGEDIKNYMVTVGYQMSDGLEFFKVVMYDKTINQQQEILRNTDGVFVITPNLNQVFKFEGDWPLNSPKPYLLQNIREVLETEHTMEKKSEGYIIKSAASYSSVPTLVKQEIILDKKMKPLALIGYTNEDQIVLKLTFQKVDLKPEFSDDYFATPKEAMGKPVVSDSLEYSLPWYPMQTFDAILSHENVMIVNEQQQHILEFTGEKSFTIVQKEAKRKDELQVEEVNGTLINELNIIGYYRENCLTVMSEQMEVNVYSTDLGMDEMIQIVQSLQVAIMNSPK
ncbi:MAG: hypothetical protein PUF50_06810 [Erysipelotrichaceae bacterium]|nr:hypothetical protein [Erysipelotrichaceae bacterium]